MPHEKELGDAFVTVHGTNKNIGQFLSSKKHTKMEKKEKAKLSY